MNILTNLLLLSATESENEPSAHAFNDVFWEILIVLMIAVTIVAISKKIKQPESIALVIVGLFFGLGDFAFFKESKDFITQSHVFQIIVISIFLPALLAEAAQKLPLSHLKENKKPILSLAFVGTFLSFIIIGFATYFLLNVPIVVAFTFAALMCPTDPISVISIFGSLGVKKKLMTIVEGESLFNDGLAVVLFKIASIHLLVYMGMGASGFASGVGVFLWVAIGGLAVGLISGYLFSKITNFFDDYDLEVLFSVILYFGAFLFAEHVLHVSGVIAVVVAALVFGNYGGKTGMSPITKLALNKFWTVIATLANSLIFFLVGLEISHIDFTDKWSMILIAILIVITARSIAVYSSLSLVRGFETRYKHVVNWGGLKGSLSIALALSLPTDFSGKEDILALTFSVVLFSLLVQGLTIKPILQKLGLVAKNEGIEEYEKAKIISHIHKVGLEELENLKTNGRLDGEGYKELQEDMKKELKQSEEVITELKRQYNTIHNEQLIDAKRIIYYTQIESIKKLVKEEVVSDKYGESKIRMVVEKIQTLDDEH